MDSFQSIAYIIEQGIVRALGFYVVILLIRVLLTWFPSIDWSRSPFTVLSQLTDPYLNFFRSFIPPLGPLDLSPIVAIFAVQILSSVVSFLFATSLSMAF